MTVDLIKIVSHNILSENKFEDEVNDELRHLQYDLSAEIVSIDYISHCSSLNTIIRYRYTV